MKSFYVLLFLLVLTNIRAQQFPSAVAISTAPANASTAYTKAWTAFHNPSILAKITGIKVAINYDNRFALKELSTKSLNVAIPSKIGSFGIAISHFGYSQYNEMQVGMAMAKSFSSKFALGLQFNYYSVYLSPTEGSKGAVIAQVGLLSEITPKLVVGFHTFNPAQTTITVGNLEKRIPSVFSLASSYSFSEDLIWLAQFDKEVDYNLQWKTGFEYQLMDSFSVKLGGYGAPFVPCLGVGLTLKKLKFEINFERHPTLSYNSVCALSYSFE